MGTVAVAKVSGQLSHEVYTTGRGEVQTTAFRAAEAKKRTEEGKIGARQH